VPVRIRRALNIESGLNDGIATPFVLLFLAAFVSEESGGDNSWLLDAIVEIGLALVVAAVVGGIGGRIMSWAAKCRWVTETSQQLYALALALSAYEISIWVGGNGFVAAFSAGLAFGATAPKQLGSVRFGEDAALFASFLVWVVFGGWMVGPVLAGGFDADAAIYAVFSLTVVRMLPVAIALAGKGFRSATVAFMGWFGPRGLASVVFSLIALEELAGSPDDVALLEIAAWTVFLSVLAHGVSARPLAATYGRRIRSGDPEAPELVDVPEPRLRRHLDLPDRRSAAEESQAA
jgi:NhaP-type Na+/H+ or K+/H+ antiporter